MTMISSQSLIEESLCAITMQVTPLSRIDLTTLNSVRASSADVASSMITIVGSCARTRAISSLCLSPPEKSDPFSVSLYS